MCFGDKKERTTTPPPRPVEKAALRQQPAKLTKPRPQVQVVTESEKSSMEITWPIDRPVDDEPPQIISPMPSSLRRSDEIIAPRPYRYDDTSVPPSNVPSLYTSSQPSTPREESLFDFHVPPMVCPPSPPPMCPPTPSSMGESLRVASLMPAPLVSAPRPTPQAPRRTSQTIQPTPQRMRRAPTPPMPRVNIPAPPVPALPVDLPGNISPAFKNLPRSKTPSPTGSSSQSSASSPTSWTTKSSASSPTSSKSPKTPTSLHRSSPTGSGNSPTGERKSPAGNRKGSPTNRKANPIGRRPPVLHPVPERAALSALQRARSMSSSMRPKFSLPETLAPFSLATPPIVMDLYEPPKPPRVVRVPPAVPERTAPLEKVQSPGRIAVVDDEVLEPDSPEAASLSAELGYEKIRLFPIPNSIIDGEKRYQEKKRRERRSNDGSRSSQDSSQGYDSRCPSPVGSLRPVSFTIGQLNSRFSMSSLGSTLRVHNHVGYELQRPASARPGAGGGGGSIPTFPSRHEAKKARKLWLAEQEEAKRQSAKMGVEGILGWDATTRRWVNKMTDDEKEAWLNQWKEKRSAQQALHRGLSSHHGQGGSFDVKPRTIVV